MNPIIALTIGSTLMGIATMMFIWPHVRVLRLQNALLEIRIRALERARCCANVNQADILEVDEMVSEVISLAPLFTTTEFAVRIHKADKEATRNDKRLTEPIAIQELGHMHNRVMLYFILETFSGMVLTIFALALLGWVRFKSIYLTPRANADCYREHRLYA